MGQTRTAEETRLQYIDAMPDSLGEVYYELYNQFVLLQIKWGDFRLMFAEGQETVDLLNKAAPVFFANLQRMMWEDVLLHLCRLTDKPKYGPNETLTILKISELIPDQDLKKTVDSQATNAKEKTNFARDWRNRRLAHRELPPLEGESFIPLAHASRQNVEEALEALSLTMNSVTVHYLGSEVGYRHGSGAPGGASNLLYHLRLGVESHQKKNDRLRDG